MNKVYIQAAASISPQKTIGELPFLTEPVSISGNRLTCVEPDYKELIDPKLIRRMSRIIKMGVAAATACLKQAAVNMPGAIVTGTAYGCLEDTGLFLGKMVEFNESLLTPTAFIQSTHNTIGAQVALLLKCNAYNNAFVHRGFSFESALLDAIMLLADSEADNVLVGGIDEITNFSHALLSRFGLYKKDLVSNLELFSDKQKGTINGEGAAFFLLCNQASGNDLATLDGLHTFYKPASEEVIRQEIETFLAQQNISPADVDLVLLGNNGDPNTDAGYDELANTIFSQNNTAYFKHLCGEYPTATSFALWVAAHVLKTGAVPAALLPENNGSTVKKVLIYNHSGHIHHSLYLLSALAA